MLGRVREVGSPLIAHLPFIWIDTFGIHKQSGDDALSVQTGIIYLYVTRLASRISPGRPGDELFFFNSLARIFNNIGCCFSCIFSWKKINSNFDQSSENIKQNLIINMGTFSFNFRVFSNPSILSPLSTLPNLKFLFA